ncbi:hypothetical protein C1645_791586 [Glomus cerebriforme]|uniref:Uncharacterized protein n=1 Tax=Glomus cerebriforme TaxID=658196 RepID=A0A397S4H9_9GLOM|nr:hypothetical protein C1645_791586 [Glomus cerebriforme]
MSIHNSPTHISQDSGENVTNASSDINENTTSSQHDNINDITAEYSFYYGPCNDFQIYHITCKEKTPEEIITQLLNNSLYLTHYFYSNDIFVFYYQQPNDKKIYQITCEMVPHSIIVQFLNSNIYGIELLYQNEHYQQNFSNRHKENLESHLREFLFNYLAPNNQSNI